MSMSFDMNYHEHSITTIVEKEIRMGIFEKFLEIPAPPSYFMYAKFKPIQDSFPSFKKSLSSLGLANIHDLNIYVNKLVTYTKEAPGVDDWQTPQETFDKRTGDCEDFAILKYAILLNSGYSEENLKLVIGHVIGDKEDHAFLIVLENEEWIVLDSKVMQLVPVKDYVNWNPIGSISGDKATIYARQFILNDIFDPRQKV